MKNSLYSNREVESLRAQVRELHQSVAELEDRLAAFEAQAEEEPWGIWPYCHVVAAWNFGRDQIHCFHRKLGKWNLARHNRRYQLQNDNNARSLRLT